MKDKKQLFFILILIIAFGVGAVADETIFHNTLSSNQYATADVSDTIQATSSSTLPPEVPTNYTDNHNGTITDNYTGLLWMQCPDGMSGTNCENGSAALREWSKAGTVCENLTLGGKTGWRLPTLKELQSIVDSGLYRPAINTDFFGGTSDAYWTSTPLAEHAEVSIFTVLFMDGSTYYTNTGNSAATRCVWSGSTN